MMRPLVIDDAFHSQLNALIVYAQENRITPEMLQMMCDGKMAIVGDDPRRVVETQFGYRIVFSIEGHPQQDKSIVWLRHLSISVSRTVAGTGAPNPVACAEIAGLLGMPSLKECELTTEPYGDGIAVNIISVIGKGR